MIIDILWNMDTKTTTIQITQDLKEDLKRLKKYGESYNGVVERLVEEYNQRE